MQDLEPDLLVLVLGHLKQPPPERLDVRLNVARAHLLRSGEADLGVLAVT